MGRLTSPQDQITKAHSRATRPLIESCSWLWLYEHHVLERVRDKRLRVGLGYVAGVAEITSWRDVSKHLVIAIHEVRDTDHRGARPFGVLTAMAIEAAICIQRQLIAINRMRNNGRLLRVIPHLSLIVSDGTRQRRRLNLLHWLRATGHTGNDVGRGVRRKRADGKDQRSANGRAAKGHSQCAHTGTILTAHFLKSVCFDIG